MESVWYRRVDLIRVTHFVTVNLAERRRTLLVDHIDAPRTRTVMQTVKSMHPFCIDAMVVLPDHLHAVCALPVADADYPMRWVLFNGSETDDFAGTDERRDACFGIVNGGLPCGESTQQKYESLCRAIDGFEVGQNVINGNHYDGEKSDTTRG